MSDYAPEMEPSLFSEGDIVRVVEVHTGILNHLIGETARVTRVLPTRSLGMVFLDLHLFSYPNYRNVNLHQAKVKLVSRRTEYTFTTRRKPTCRNSS